LKRGHPLSLVSNKPFAGSSWTVYSVDQHLVARLNFETGLDNTFHGTAQLAPGLYFFRITVTDAAGSSTTFVRRVVIQP
jgi:hypothetical protein